MKTLFVHASRNNLKQLDKPSRIFEKFEGVPIFDHAFQSYSKSKELEQIVLVCPKRDKDFFLQKIKNIEILAINDDEPGAFVESNSRFNPLNIFTKDFFGLWNAISWEKYSKQYNASLMLILNLESSWFISPKHIDLMFGYLKQENFIFPCDTTEDFIAGLDYGRGRVEKIKAEIKMKEIFIGDFIKYSEKINDLFFEIKQQHNAFSLRWERGFKFLKKLDGLEIFKPLPQIIRIEADCVSKIKDDIFRDFYEIPYWIFQMNKFVDINDLIKEIYQNIIGSIYVELPLKFLDSKKLESLYKSGVKAVVMLVELNNKLESIDSLLKVRETYPSKALMLKVQNNAEDAQPIFSLFKKWQNVLDGIVITPDFKFGAHLANASKTFCTKASKEIYINENGMIPICTRTNVKILDNFDRNEWGEMVMKAGTLKACKDCLEKFSYGSPNLNVFTPKGVPEYIEKRHMKNTLAQIDSCLNSKNLEEALAIMEKILSSDPANRDVWERINNLEKILND